MALLNIEIDGQPTQVESGRTVMDAAKQLRIKIPHFCYHRKLSIAANCRMCLVQVEKAPKPLPACATPVTEGMKVQTHSDYAIKAQKAVMEFLLINHPLDCPICDQGGECKLQDISVGYGGVASRYREEKRVISNKDLGPLISTDMTRCILCTRCVRYGQEIAGVMELGVGGRGEYSEILAFMDLTVDSEVSGNAIDLCPVGALTSKPFRYTARSWELTRYPSVSPHDGLGSNLEVQVKQNTQVARVLPRANEAINECWLSDRDRFSYQALRSEDRLARPMIKQDGQWVETGWAEALQVVVDAFTKVRNAHGSEALGALVSPHQTLEELYLAQRLMRELGSHNIDHRTRQTDFSLDAVQRGAPWLGVPVARWSHLKSCLIIGSTLRQEQPLLAVRLRRAVTMGAQVHLINPFVDDLAMPVARQLIGTPSEMPGLLAQVLQAVALRQGQPVREALQPMLGGQPSATADQIAESLLRDPARAIFLGHLAQHHPAYGTLYALAEELARLLDCPFGILGEAANSVGATLAGAVPHRGPLGISSACGLDAQAMLRTPRKAYLVMGLEPQLDCADPSMAMAALKSADFVVALSAFKGQAEDWATVILPIAPFTETAGTFVSMEGRAQSFNGVVAPKDDARPAWKVLRVLGNLFELSGFEFESIEEVRTEISPDLALVAGQSGDNGLSGVPKLKIRASLGTIERIGEVPLYHADPLVRRSPALQATRLGSTLQVTIHPQLGARLGLSSGQLVRVRQGEGVAELPLVFDASVPDGCARIPAAHPATAGLGDALGTVSLEACA
ncbi:MAG: NADH-quinone oxidoreductase subunit G [Betaproteobacteria bacterium]|nr:NADH-quinone oxidoreductase subunit G [Betaproteobacteria bacterium]